MKILIAVTFLLFSQSGAYAQSQNPFSSLKYDRAVMYDFSGSKGYNSSIVDGKGHLAATVRKSVQLSSDEAGQLAVKVGLKSSYGAGTASCFDPHLGFVFYLNEKVVAYISVCMDCNRLVSSLKIPAQLQGRQKVEGYEDVYYYLREGMSVAFRKFLNSLLKKNNFSHQVEQGSMWGGN